MNPPSRMRTVVPALGAALVLLGSTGLVAAASDAAPGDAASTNAPGDAASTASAASSARKARPLPADLYRGSVEVVRDATGSGTPARTTITGTVFEDRDKDSRLDRRDRGLSGVVVSNGRDVTRSDSRGR